MNTFILSILLLVTSVIAVVMTIVSVMSYYHWKQSKKSHSIDMLNWTSFILDNLDNPRLRHLLERRISLIEKSLEKTE